MQNPLADVTVMIKLVCATKQFLRELRSDESFKALIKSAAEISLKLDNYPIFPQVQVGQKRRLFNSGGTDTQMIGEAKFQIVFLMQ
jgi:hypothetical protein